MRIVKLVSTIILLVFYMGVFAQSKGAGSNQSSISGIVVDSEGEAVIGASVLVKGTKVGSVTDLDGRFSIKASPQDKLVITYIGYEPQELPVNDKTLLHVVLRENAKSLDEVIVIGYGSVKKSNLTTSVSKIGSEAIEERPITTLSEAFSGQLAGVQTQIASGVPGEDLQITIRGNGSLNSATPPLYVIDGVISESINDVNPNDVASIQVLKDASSSAIYGARGSNGVVLIETKRAKQGKAAVSFDAYYGLQQPDRMPEVMSPTEWFAYNIWMINAQYLNKGGTNSMDIPNKNRPTGDQIPTSWLLNPDSDTPDWRLNPNVSQTDWVDMILHTAPVQSYQLSASGKGEMGSVFFSAGYLDQEGIVRETGFQRINLRLNAELNINKRMKIGANLAPTISTQARGEAEGKDKVILTALQFSPLMNSQKGTVEWGFDNETTGAANNVNPLQRLKEITDDMKINRFAASAWFEYQIIPDLTFKTIYNNNTRSSVYEYFRPKNVTAPNQSGGQVSYGDGYSESNNNWGIQNILTYDRTLLKRHHFNVMLGQSAESNTTHRVSATGTGYPLESVSTINTATTTTGSSYRSIVRTASFFSRLSYNFEERYLMSASIRRDGSTRFGPGNRWGYFPSFSAGWKISEESFMKDIEQINLLKLRWSWGEAGNDRIGNAEYLSLISVGNGVYGGTNQPSMYPSNFANPDLKWETTRTVDYGLDLSLLKNRIQVSFDYYINTISNLLYNLQLPATTGFSNMRTNLASMENRGWEVDITSTNINNKRFRWNTTLNFSKSKNKVLEMGDYEEYISEAWSAQFITKVGGPVSQFYLYRTDGLLTESDFGVGPDGKYDRTQPLVPIMNNQIPGNLKFVDTNEDGAINEDDKQAYGSNLPDLTYGLTNTFSYKGFDLSILLQGQFGGDVFYLASRNINTGRRFNNALSGWLNAYKETYRGGDPIPHELGVDMSWDGKTPNPYGIGANGVNENTVTDTRVYDATFLKIKNVSIGYNFQPNLLRKVNLRKAKVYFTIENLYTFTDYIGNPEVNSYAPNNPMLRGVDYSTYPLTRKYTLGLNLTF